MKRNLLLVGPTLVAVVAFVSACQPAPPSPAPTAPPAVGTSFTFDGGGYGHGVGMSQYGAKGRAEAGMAASEIVGAYYQGTAITSIASTNPRVQIARSAATDVSSPTSSITAGSTTLAAAGQTIHLAVSGSSIVVTNGASTTTLSSPAAFGWANPERVNVSASGRGYRYGRLVATVVGSQMDLVIDSHSIEQYLYGLGEVPSSWPMEAMKAQALAARTYVRNRISHPQNANFDLYSSVMDQAFIGADQTNGTTGPRWTAAVDATASQVLTYKGSVIEAYYDASNGGHNEDSGYIWSTSLPYLKPIADPYDNSIGNPYFTWHRTYTGAELGAWLEAAGRGTVGTVTSISIGGNVGVSGRTNRATITVTGSAGTITVTGTQLRSAINAKSVASKQLLGTKFTVRAS